MSNAREDLVLVTGATGFVAMHAIVRLLEDGWRVRGTIRDLARADALARVVAPRPEARERLSFVEVDLSRDHGWSDAVRGCRFVLHVASPVPSAAPKNPDDVIAPARDGALRVLRAASEARVERVVMTSSTAAVLYGHPRDGTKTYDERDWSNLDGDVGAYERSKTLAERAAWEFARALPEDRRIELVTIQPGAILGPVLAEDFSVSGEIVRKLMTRELPGCPDLGWALVDVRDVAAIHVAAMTHPRAAGERFIVASEHVAMREIARILREHFGPVGFAIPERRVPSWLLKIVALWDNTIAMTVKELGKRQDVSSNKAREVLGWKPIGVERMVIDMAESMIRVGAIRPPRGVVVASRA